MRYMKPSIYRISLDVHDAHSSVCLDMKHKETARQIDIALTDGGFPYQISEECYAVFAATKADGKKLLHHCEIRNNIIQYIVRPQTTAAVGLCECEIRLYGANDKLLFSPGFNILVSEKAVTEDDDLISEDDVDELTHLISEAAKVIAEGKTVNAEGEALIDDMEAKREALEQQIQETGNHAANAQRHSQFAIQASQSASTSASNAYNRAQDAQTAAGNAKTSENSAKTSAQTAVNMANAALQSQRAAEAAAERAEEAAEQAGNGSDSGQNVTLTTAQINALDGMFKVCAYDESKDISGAYAVFRTAFGIPADRTLTSISATYGGGDVAVGTAVNALAGIVVTAHYSDGTSEPVTGYTLSGTIAKGSNTVTVTYEGLTTTFIVTGIADEPEAVTYTVTNALTNVLSNNAATSATEGTKYTATLTAASGYIMGDVTVTMGGVDITATAYSGGVVTIPSVTGNIVITAAAVEDSGAITLDSIAYENKTYRDIFVTGNGFANGDMEGDALPGNGSVNAGTPELTSKVYCTPYHSLKCCGATSQQLKNVGIEGNSPGGGASSGSYFAFKGRCDRYGSGWLGVLDLDVNITSVTDGFVTRSTMNFGSAVRFYGSGSLDGKPGDLDGYLDAIVYIGLDRFTNKPSKALLDELYETYILILQNGGSYMPGEV